MADGLAGAITDIEDGCDDSQYIPDFSLKLGTQRPENQSQANGQRFVTLGLSYDPESSPKIIPLGDNAFRVEMALFESRGADGSVPMSTVILFGDCPREINRNRHCHRIPGEGWKIDWSLPVNQKIIMHEIFHGLGVGHDRAACPDKTGLMQSSIPAGASLRDEYCAYADHLNCIGDDCPKDPRPCDFTKSGASGGTDPDCIDVPDPAVDPIEDLFCELNPLSIYCGSDGDPTGFGGNRCFWDCSCIELGDGPAGPINNGGFTLCVDDPFSPLNCDWIGLSYATSSSPPGTTTKGSQSERCDNLSRTCKGSVSWHWECPGPSPTIPGRLSGVSGDGSAVTITTPWHDATVSGLVPVGVAVSEATYSGEVLTWSVDGRRVHLSDPFTNSSTTGLCDMAQVDDPHCPYIGFGGMLDTTRFSDGVHRLQVFAERNDPNLPFWTFAQVEIEVRNQTQPAEPQIMVAEGWGGHTRIPNDGTYTYSFGERNLFALPLVSPFLVCNQGTADLHLSNLSTMVTGDGFSRQYGGPQTSIRPQRCSQLGVRFEVDDPGVYTGTVRLESNAPENDPFQFAIDGTAVSTVSELPRLGIYLPYPNEVLAGTILVSGWALDDGDLSTSNLAFRLNGVSVSLSGLTYGASHTDVCANNADLGSPDCPNVGWSGWLNTTNLPDGAHRLDVLVTDATGQTITETRWFSSEHSPQGAPPRVWMAVPGNNQVISGVVTLSGWALSAGTIDTSDLRFYLDGRPILPGNPFYGIARPGVCNVHADLPSPNCPNVGWRATGDSRLIANGPHTLQLFVQDANGSMTVFTRQFHVQN